MSREGMVKKIESGKLIRSVCHDWRKERGIPMPATTIPSFSDFYSWAEARYPQALRFRSVGGSRDAVERWFDDELKQTWRN
jgi:hypothetical protein